MKNLRSFRGDDRGAATVEVAFALPVLAFVLWGIAQIGMAFQANAGMQHALGEGARLATICLNPTSTGTCSVPTDDAIKDKIEDAIFGVNVGTFSDPTVTTPASTECSKCRDLSVTFTMPMNFLLFEGPEVDITRTKRVYVTGS